jgi:propanediol dehydratase large subunit
MDSKQIKEVLIECKKQLFNYTNDLNALAGDGWGYKYAGDREKEITILLKRIDKINFQ